MGLGGANLAKVATTLATRPRRARFHVVLIKPTHYYDDGYTIQWIKAAIPSNTLACLNGLAEDASRRRVLGPHVAIRVHTYDETNRRVRPDRIIRLVHRADGRAVIGLVGVQSNQFPPAVELRTYPLGGDAIFHQLSLSTPSLSPSPRPRSLVEASNRQRGASRRRGWRQRQR